MFASLSAHEHYMKPDTKQIIGNVTVKVTYTAKKFKNIDFVAVNGVCDTQK